MNLQKKNNRDKVVYSTDPNFVFEQEEQEEVETLENQKQNLCISLDKKQRAGKKVTLVSNFVGKQGDLLNLSKILKTKCSVGGSVKDGKIVLQGDFREKIFEILTNLGYKSKVIK